MTQIFKAKVFPGRYTAQFDGPFVVFIIGMRINQFWAIHKWLPVAMAMPKILKVLIPQKEKGLLHTEFHPGFRGATLVQYWKSFDALEKFAKDKKDPHLSAWGQYTRRIGSDGSVGVWHETYVIDPGKHESIYANMPRIGLAAAGNHVTAEGSRQFARGRLEGK